MGTSQFTAQLEQLLRYSGKIPAKYYSQTLLFIFMLLICQQLAVTTWRLLPVGVPVTSWHPHAVTSDNSQNRLDIDSLMGLNLFGKVAEKDPKEFDVKSAPITQLNLRLTGVLASSVPKLSIAIIAGSSGSQASYFIGDYVSGTQARVRRILGDRVILSLNGVNQTLMLDGADYNESVPHPGLSTKPKSHQLSASMRETLMKDPAKIERFIKIQPWYHNRKVIGYRVGPGLEGGLLEQLGLKKNDIIESINGYQLNDKQQLSQIMSELPELGEVTVTVNRNGQSQQLQVKLKDQQDKESES
ncbi:type II secretion system protein GspC [Dongshaea marina]|uniref:type II secretion system protein GspC n=1 Tax=Dongshaea marina TaxID=2047966 RepID=UPI000D3E6160|nr:type II secretion system protein GspC [Dongshaea marina]